MILLRIILHTIILVLSLLIFSAVASAFGLGLVSGLLDWLAPGAFVVFSLTLATLLNRRPLLLVVLLGIGLLVCFPVVKGNPVAFLFAICLGVAAALLTGALFRETRAPE